MKKEIADKILNDTEVGYDFISEKFSETRKHFWRGLEGLKDYTHPGDTVFDFGCGNGRLLELIGASAPMQYYGADVSEKLVKIADKKYPVENCHFIKTDSSQRTLPFDDDFFNTAYSIAVFHHFPSVQYRDDMARELFRVTKTGGRVVVTVWSLWPASTRGDFRLSTRGGQKKYFKNILKNWQNKFLGKSNLDWNDCMISFTDNSGNRFERFHHAFTKRELQKLFERAGFEIEKCEVADGRNIVLIGKKKERV